MTIDTVARWHQLVASRNPEGLDSLLSEAVVFHSPIANTPKVGKALAIHFLKAAFRVLANDSFRYVRELTGSHDAVLEFQVEIDGVSVNGVDLIKWDDEGRILEFKVMLRPLKAINLVQQKMGEMLQSTQ